MEPTQRKLLLIFSTMAIVLGATTAVLYFLGARVLAASQLVARDHIVIATLEDTLSSLKDAETGQRGFIITGKDIYLQPYTDALHNIDIDFVRLQSWVNANQLDRERINQLSELKDQKLAELTKTIRMRRDTGIDPTTQYIDNDIGFNLMNQLRAGFGQLIDEQSKALDSSRKEADHLTATRTITFLCCAFLELGFLVWTARRVGKEIRDRVAQTVAAQEQRELYATTLASIGDAVITTDAAGRITFLNQVATDLTGWSTIEAIDKPLPDVFRIINETSRLPVESPVDKVLRLGQVVGLANHTVLIRKDQTELPIDDSGAPIRNPDGSIRGVVLVFRDFTAQKQAEAVIRRSEERLRLAVDAAELGTFYCDVPLDKINFNDTLKRQFFLPPDADVDFKLAYERLHPDDVLPNQRAVDRAMHDRVPYDNEYRVLSPLGALRWIRAIGRFYYNADGSPQRLDGVTIDITDRKQQMQRLQNAQDQAEAAGRAKDQFLATLSHELRTPLTPVLATLDLWSRLQGPPAGFAEDVRMLRRNVELEARLIDDLLDLTRVVKGKLNLSLQTVDMHELIKQVLNICEEEAHARQVTVETNLSASHAKVRGDTARLQQVLWNVLRNAIKFSSVGGCVTFATSNDSPGNLQITVTDRGIGMTPETVDRLFRPFEQGSDDITRRFGGLGLGLTISKALLDMQGGIIRAASAGPQLGSTFTLTLPTITALQGPASPSPSPAALPAATTRLRILLAEDHADTARILKLIMISWGHAVETAETVATAISTAKGQPFDLLISDIGLPDGTGLDLIRQFREFSQIPAIALSGFGMDDDVAECMKAGFNAHLTKPTDLQALQKTIAKLASPASSAT